MKLWQKNQAPHQKIDHFTVGKDREYDLYLAPYDCQASIAHAQMLSEIGILSQAESNQLVSVLEDLKNDAKNGDFVIETEFEDMHSKIEYVLTQKLGDLGKKSIRLDQEMIRYWLPFICILRPRLKRLKDSPTAFLSC